MGKTALIIFTAIFFDVAVIIPIAIFFQHKKREELLGGVKNYDTFMTRFVFRISLSEEEFIRRLKTRNAADVLPYEYDEAGGIIAFNIYNVKHKYRLFLQPVEGFFILHVESMRFHSRAAYHINPFFMGKFDAVPLDFNQYGI